MSIGASFDPRRNSLNAVRLALALVVVVSHAFPLGGYGDELRVGVTTVGQIAVAGFFAISGYLITGSKFRSSNGRYLWHRFLRIFPGFWVCLLLIAVVFAPIAYLRENGTLNGFDTFSAGIFVVANSTLRILSGGIHGTLENVPYPPSWDGSLWSLSWEFVCYLLVLGLFAIRGLRLPVVAALFSVCAVLLTVESFVPGFVPDFSRVYFNAVGPGDVVKTLWTVGMFAAGALVYFLRDRIPDRASLAIAAVAVAIGGLMFLDVPHGIIGVPLAYLMIWLGIHLPLHNLTGKADFSYGLYIYAYPVAQLLAVFGLHKLGLPIYLAVTIVLGGGLAVASWYLVERRALSLKDYSPKWRASRNAHPVAEPAA